MKKLYSNNIVDLLLLLAVSFIFAVLYIGFEAPIMEYSVADNNSLFMRFLPVLAIQFGMSCLGPVIVIFKNKEIPKDYSLIEKNSIKAIFFSLCFAVPTLLFTVYFKGIHSYLFRECFLQKKSCTVPFHGIY